MPIHSAGIMQLMIENDVWSSSVDNQCVVQEEILNLQESQRIMKIGSEDQRSLLFILCEVLDEVVARNDMDQVNASMSMFNLLNVEQYD